MARSYAPIYTSIWHDENFLALSAQAQRVYFLALSQPNITYCGVVSFTAKRWGLLAANTTPKAIEKAVQELEGAGFVMLDDDTEELWIRSFVKHNGVLRQPQLVRSMQRAYTEIHSPAIRAAFLAGLPPAQRAALAQPAASPPPDPDGSLPEPCPPTEGLGDVSGVVASNPEPSSSSSEDEEALRSKAELALWLRRRKTELEPVLDTEAWMAADIERHRDRYLTEIAAERERVAARDRALDCRRCNSAGLELLEDGTVRRCDHARVSA